MIANIQDKRLLKGLLTMCILFVFLLGSSVFAADISVWKQESPLNYSSWLLGKLELYKYQYITTSVSIPCEGAERADDYDNPGFYYLPPTCAKEVPVTDENRDFLKAVIESNLSPEIYDDDILDFIYSAQLSKLSRTEFYFSILSNDTPIRFSGWYDRFAHIIVFTNYDSKESFLKEAEKFFKLPKLDISNVEYDEQLINGTRSNFFYSYEADVPFKLVGYPVFRYSDDDDETRFVDYVVLDLTIYAKGEEE